MLRLMRMQNFGWLGLCAALAALVVMWAQQVATAPDQHDVRMNVAVQILVRDQLGAAVAHAQVRGESMTCYVVATGMDGYSVVLSLAEVDPDFRAGQVIVADSRDVKPLGKSRPYQLIVPDDKRPAR